MNGINSIRINNNLKITFKAEHIVYPNEVVFDDLEEAKKPDFNFSNTEEKIVSITPKKESFFKKLPKRCINFIDGVKQYYQYKNGIKQAVKINAITKERAKQILEEQKVILFNILKK